MTIPEPHLCPTCGGPATGEVNYGRTLAYYEPFFDADGRRHVHDGNRGGLHFTCAAGHEWEASPRGCWCGWKPRA